MAACCASAPGQMRRWWRGWPRRSRHDHRTCRLARAAGDAAGRFPPRGTLPGSAGGRGTRREPVLRRGAGIPGQAPRQGKDRALGCDGSGAGLEAAGGGHVLLAADYRWHRAAVCPAVRGAVLGARLSAAAKRETDSHTDRRSVDCSPMREIGNPTQDLPDDPAVLRALLLAAWAERDSVTSERDSLSAERDSLSAERDALMERIELLQHLLQKLRRMQFGPRSERLPEDQLRFAFEEVEASLAAAEAEAEAAAEKGSTEQRKKNTARRKATRGRLPAHLPRIEQVLMPESTACPCCQGAMVEIGCDTAERLDVIPVQFRAWSPSGRSSPAVPARAWSCRHLPRLA